MFWPGRNGVMCTRRWLSHVLEREVMASSARDAVVATRETIALLNFVTFCVIFLRMQMVHNYRCKVILSYICTSFTVAGSSD